MKTSVANLSNLTITLSLPSSASGALLIPVPPLGVNQLYNDVYPFVTITVAQAAYVTVGNNNANATAAASTVVNGGINSYTSITAGTGYTNGTYNSVPIIPTSGTGTGSGAVANITVASGHITSVIPNTPYGFGYTVGESVTTLAANIGGTGTGFSVLVNNLVGSTQTYTQGSMFLPVAGIYTFALGRSAQFISILNGTTTAANFSLLFGTDIDTH